MTMEHEGLVTWTLSVAARQHSCHHRRLTLCFRFRFGDAAAAVDHSPKGPTQIPLYEEKPMEMNLKNLLCYWFLMKKLRRAVSVLRRPKPKLTRPKPQDQGLGQEWAPATAEWPATAQAAPLPLEPMQHEMSVQRLVQVVCAEVTQLLSSMTKQAPKQADALAAKNSYSECCRDFCDLQAQQHYSKTMTMKSTTTIAATEATVMWVYSRQIEPTLLLQWDAQSENLLRPVASHSWHYQGTFFLLFLL
jgi:hypothetical protein